MWVRIGGGFEHIGDFLMIEEFVFELSSGVSRKE